jgi:lipoate-protein ligase A
MTPWTVHDDTPASGSLQMARDELALRLAAETGRCTLRLYTWERLTLSLGRSQTLERQIDLEACRSLDIPVVRRVTGGRAVLHGSDLTYSVAAPLGTTPSHAGPLASASQQGILALYRELSQVFVDCFERLGLAPQVQGYTGRERAELASPVCFATPSAFEILLDGRKIVGSAQRQVPTAFLQHGSIPLAPQNAVLARIFRDGAGEAMGQSMTDLESAGVLSRFSLSEVRHELLDSFARTLGVKLDIQARAAEEEAEAQRLAAGYPNLAQSDPQGPNLPSDTPIRASSI